MTTTYLLNLNQNFVASLKEIEGQLRNSEVILNIMCDENADALIYGFDLNLFTTAIVDLYKQYSHSISNILHLNNIDYLSEFLIYKILSNHTLVDMLHPLSFKQLLAKNENIARFILSKDYLCKKLNSINPSENSQTLAYSCAARAILMALASMDMITETDFTRCKEIEIYLNICEEYGKSANAEKIVSYLQKLNIPISGIEVKESIAAVFSLSNNINHFGVSPLLRAYSLFKKSLFNTKYLLSKDDSLFPENHPALMVVRNTEENGSHIVFCLKEANKYIVVNPTNGAIKEFSHLDELMAGMNSLGVFFLMSPGPNFKEKFVSYQN